MIATAMMMAAGLGTRMRPLTETRPKPLVELAGRTLLDHGLDRLAAAGVESVVVNVHYLADQIERHAEGRQTPSIVISDERDALLETGGGIARALPHLGEAPFYVINSDAVWWEDGRPLLQKLADAWNGDTMDCLLALAPRTGSLGYHGAGDFHKSAGGALSRRGADGPAPFVNTGVYIVHPRVFEDAPEGAFSMNLIWDALIPRGRLHGVELDGLWMHVGTPEALAEAEARLIELGA